MCSIESQATFQRYMLPQSSRSKNKPSKKPAWKQVALLATYFHAGFSIGLFYDPEAGGGMFLWNVNCLATDYTVISHKIELFITKTVRTLNPTFTKYLENLWQTPAQGKNQSWALVNVQTNFWLGLFKVVTVFSVVPCSSVGRSQCFRGTCFLHFQGHIFLPNHMLSHPRWQQSSL
jgi:hypothetical protein